MDFAKAFLLIFSYVMIAAIAEAVLYSRKGDKAFHWNEHILYIAMTGCVCLLYLVDSGMPNIYDRFAVVLVVWLCYPLVHDGIYFEARRRIDVPTYRWYSYSTDRSNRIEIRPIVRIVMASAASVSFTIYLLLR